MELWGGGGYPSMWGRDAYNNWKGNRNHNRNAISFVSILSIIIIRNLMYVPTLYRYYDRYVTYLRMHIHTDWPWVFLRIGPDASPATYPPKSWLSEYAMSIYIKTWVVTTADVFFQWGIREGRKDAVRCFRDETCTYTHMYNKVSLSYYLQPGDWQPWNSFRSPRSSGPVVTHSRQFCFLLQIIIRVPTL